MTDSIRAIGKRTGEYKENRFADILDPKPQDTRSGDEIAADVIKNAGLTVAG